MGLKATWAGTSPYSKFLLAVGVILISAVLFTLISTLAATGIYGTSITQLQSVMSDLSNPKSIAIMKLIQTISTIGTLDRKSVV